MPYDVLFVSSDSVGGSHFPEEDYAYLQDRYGLTPKEVHRLVRASAPVWLEDGVQMSLMAAENWFQHGRRFSLTAEEIREFTTTLSGEVATRFGNGIYVTDHLVKQGLGVELINDLALEWGRFLECVAQGPRIIALSTTFLTGRNQVEVTTRRMRQAAPGVPIVVGGPLVLYSHKVMEEAPHHFAHPQVQQTYFFGGAPPDPSIDLAIIDERGEGTLAEVARRLRAGLSWQNLPNVACAAGGRWVVNPRRPEEVAVDDEGVAWDTLDRKYLGREVAIRGSRGCPMRCKFCSFVVLHPDFSLKSVDVLRAELRRIAARSDVIKHVSFVDDNLFLSKKAVNDYCRMMVEESFPFSWSGFMRLDSITEENIRWIKESGCNFLMLGLESGDVELLRAMRKVQRPERVRRAMELLNDAGVSTLSTLVIGFPGETQGTIDRTIELLNSFPDRGSAFHWYNCWVHNVTPLTPVDKERATWGLEGILLDWRHDTLDVAGAFHQRDRLLREVRRGGAYSGPYAFDGAASFAARGEEGLQDVRRYYKLRHRVACIDHWGLGEMDGSGRAETIAEMERIVLGGKRA
ncbi:MAG: radical SAM protein [Planctomycetes bacterium]|nr:radical SAM protein [Planctomycetota bacterium]